jgi:hypothetical protein
VDRLSAGLPGHRQELLHRVTVPEDQPAAPLAQLRVQIGQRLEQELSPGARGVAAVQDPVVEAEHRYHDVGLPSGGLKRGVVMNAEVTPEPEDGGHERSLRSMTAPLPGGRAADAAPG